MFSKILTTAYTKEYSKQIAQLKYKIENADAILIGAGAGLSTSSGFEYSGRRFKKYFSDFEKKYGFQDMYSGGFYPYKTLEEYWAWWSRHIWVNRYNVTVGEPYIRLREIVKDKNYFVITTNVDHQFQLAQFDKSRLFYTQGDYGLWQCSKPCHNKTYDNRDIVCKMVIQQRDMHIPTELIPKCPVCGAPMTMNLRCDDKFVQDDGWYSAAERYDTFIQKYKDKNILFLELGVGYNTPAIIKYPFWQMTAQNNKAAYACINYKEAASPKDIESQSICINKDLLKVLTDIAEYQCQ